MIKCLWHFCNYFGEIKNSLVTLSYLGCCGRKEVVQLLLNYPNSGIEFNARDDNGHTAFVLAYINGQNDIVQLLESKLNL